MYRQNERIDNFCKKKYRKLSTSLNIKAMINKNSCTTINISNIYYQIKSDNFISYFLKYYKQ